MFKDYIVPYCIIFVLVMFVVSSMSMVGYQLCNRAYKDELIKIGVAEYNSVNGVWQYKEEYKQKLERTENE